MAVQSLYRTIRPDRFTMPQFRWPRVEHDIALAKEVVGRHPTKLSDWETIGGFKFGIHFSQQSCWHQSKGVQREDGETADEVSLQR